ncbi:hypothetical protein ACFPM0_31330 [Pseudonocardia sulfidoxydans]
MGVGRLDRLFDRSPTSGRRRPCTPTGDRRAWPDLSDPGCTLAVWIS